MNEILTGSLKERRALQIWNQYMFSNYYRSLILSHELKMAYTDKKMEFIHICNSDINDKTNKAENILSSLNYFLNIYDKIVIFDFPEKYKREIINVNYECFLTKNKYSAFYFTELCNLINSSYKVQHNILYIFYNTIPDSDTLWKYVFSTVIGIKSKTNTLKVIIELE